MDYWHLIFQIPAVISGATIVSDMLPFTLDRRYVALLVFLAALVVLNLPVVVSLALGLVLVSSIVSKYLGVSFSGKEPFPFGKYRTAITNIVRHKIEELLPKKPATEFLTKPYPEEPVSTTVVRKFVPELLQTELLPVRQIESLVPVHESGLRIGVVDPGEVGHESYFPR